MQLAVLFLAAAVCAAPAQGSLVNSVVARKIDLTTHLCTVSTTVTVKNTGGAAAAAYTLPVDKLISGSLAFTSVQVDNEDIEPTEAKEAAVQIKAGQSVELQIVQIYIHSQAPFPKELAQADKQMMMWTGSLYYPTPYKTTTQTTEVLMAGRVEGYTKVKPAKAEGTKVMYGPFTDTEPGSSEELSVHFENFTPFLTTTKYEREIMISHWGYTTVTETAEMVHSGGILKGGFSRLDFQRTPDARRNAIARFVTRLPAAATDVYYRDVIGNISTSNLREEDDGVFVEIQPRFPLFGGWKTEYTLGYTLPTQELLFTEDGAYHVVTRFISHIYDNFVIDEAVVKVVLPEGSTDIKVEAPFAVERSEGSLVTYFDITGRPVVILKKKNLVEEHMQEFTVSYNLSATAPVREPLMAVAFVAVLFAAAIVISRIDLNLKPDAKID